MLSAHKVFGPLSLALAISAFAAGPASAQTAAERSTDQFACKDILREGGAQRDAAIAFIHGYLVGKSGANKFNVEKLQQQTDAFIDRCLDNPTEKALDAMMKVQS